MFKKTILDSGVRVVTERIPSVRSLAIGIWIEVGSRDEAEHEAGISHFIEHAVFRGTKRRRTHNIAQFMESVGGYLNAFTSKEQTCYLARCLDEHLPRAIDVLSDIVLDPTFPAKEIEREKDVVLEEIRMYADNPEDVVFDVYEAQMYADHPLGRPIIGVPETVQSFTPVQLGQYVDRNYTPGRIVVAAAGNLEHEHVVGLIQKAFAKSDREPNPHRRSPLDGYSPSVMGKTRPIQQAHVVLGAPSYDLHHENRTALSVLNTILGGGMSSRLNQNVREKYGYCYNIYSFVNFLQDAGDFGVYMGTDPTKVERAKAVVLRELEKLTEKPVSKRMLNMAKNQVKGALMMGLESLNNRMNRIAKQEIYYNRYFSLDEVTAFIDEVDEAKVQEVARELFVPERFSQTVIAPAA
ncbi:MAG: pitrilysin family protein [Bacteroidota bacterium]